MLGGEHGRFHTPMTADGTTAAAHLEAHEGHEQEDGDEEHRDGRGQECGDLQARCGGATQNDGQIKGGRRRQRTETGEQIASTSISPASWPRTVRIAVTTATRLKRRIRSSGGANTAGSVAGCACIVSGRLGSSSAD